MSTAANIKLASLVAHFLSQQSLSQRTLRNFKKLYLLRRVPFRRHSSGASLPQDDSCLLNQSVSDRHKKLK
ncbi:MAG: hypothetical protein RL222_1815 [Bacteroidota bacterium]|jgi:hypothetical protein